MRDRRRVGAAGARDRRQPLPARGPAAAGVPRVRLGRRRRRDGRPASTNVKVAGRVSDLRDAVDARRHGPDRDRPHPLGDPRRADRRERPPAPRRRRPHRGRPQRHRRERRGTARQADRRRRRAGRPTPTPRCSPTWSPGRPDAGAVTLEHAVRADARPGRGHVRARRARPRPPGRSSSSPATAARSSLGLGDDATLRRLRRRRRSSATPSGSATWTTARSSP